MRRDREAAKARIEDQHERENRVFGALGLIGSPD